MDGRFEEGDGGGGGGGNQHQEEDTPKICVSKLKINGPKISFNFFKQNRFWWMDALKRGMGGGGVRKSVQRMLCVKKLICESSVSQSRI